MFTLPTQWIVTGSVILTAVEASLAAMDKLDHTSLLMSPVNVAVVAFLGVLGVHQAVNFTMKRAMKKP